MTPEVWAAWAELLRQVPDSRLVLMCPGGNATDRVMKWANQNGLNPARLELVEGASLPIYFRYYHRIDIALDVFPYPGGVTTMDALWMGVPVVTLPGETAISRGGLSILSNVGLKSLVARDVGDYVRIAADLARDMPRIVELRRTLRQQMLASPLRDAGRVTGEVESAFRVMWRQWCEDQLVRRVS